MFGKEVSFIPKDGQVQLCAWREKDREEEGGQEGAARDVESCACVPARAVLCATPLMGMARVTQCPQRVPVPPSELLASPSVSLGLKDMHFVFLSASQPLRLVLNQRNGDLCQGWRRNPCAKCTDKPEHPQWRRRTVSHFESNVALRYCHGPRCPQALTSVCAPRSCHGVSG